MQYRLRTLLILLAVLPPVLAVAWWCRGAIADLATVPDAPIKLAFMLGLPIAVAYAAATFARAVTSKR